FSASRSRMLVCVSGISSASISPVPLYAKRAPLLRSGPAFPADSRAAPNVAGTARCHLRRSASVNVEIEVLLGDLLVFPIVADRLDRCIDLFLEFGVVFAHTGTDTRSQDLEVFG